MTDDDEVMRVELCVRPDGEPGTFFERGDAFMRDLQELARKHDLYYAGTSSFIPYWRYRELSR